MPRHFVKARARAFLTAVLVMTLCGPSIAGAASLIARQVQSDQAQSDAPYAGFVADAARRFGIPEAWIHAVMRAESLRRCDALGFKKQRAGVAQLFGKSIVLRGVD